MRCLFAKNAFSPFSQVNSQAIIAFSGECTYYIWLALVYDLPVSLSGCYDERRVRLLSFLSFRYMSAYFSSHVHKFANNFRSTTNSQLKFCQKQIELFLGKVIKS